MADNQQEGSAGGAEEAPRFNMTEAQFGDMLVAQGRHANSIMKAQAQQTREIVAMAREGL